MFESEESCTHVMHIVFGKMCVLICIKKPNTTMWCWIKADGT